MLTAEKCYTIFQQSIEDYHHYDDVDHPLQNPYASNQFEHLLYHKNWIDTVQWHLEDEIRNPHIDPIIGLSLKRRIDESNQQRTDVVEEIDHFYLRHFDRVKPRRDARVNTESPAWALDRLSILSLKIYHMREETEHTKASPQHIASCIEKLIVLLRQRRDLSHSIDELLDDIRAGRKYMKVYKQMKMYNDPALNPVLYAQANPNA